MSMMTPLHMDRLGLLYTRTYTDLKGITAAMDTQISRILTQGMADGDGPILLARKMLGAINGTGLGDLALTDKLGRFIPAKRRAEILARTEIIRAHHQATIQEYRNWGVLGVNVMAEMVTAGDNRVCEACEALTLNNPYTLEDAMNLIPVHPQCRCLCLPFEVGVDTLITKTK
jgi:SPP1 gp7 family putative phage head morphogenesis protein